MNDTGLDYTCRHFACYITTHRRSADLLDVMRIPQIGVLITAYLLKPAAAPIDTVQQVA